RGGLAQETADHGLAPDALDAAARGDPAYVRSVRLAQRLDAGAQAVEVARDGRYGGRAGANGDLEARRPVADGSQSRRSTGRGAIRRRSHAGAVAAASAGIAA